MVGSTSIADLDQFCAETITKYFYPYTKCSFRVMNELWLFLQA